MTAEDTVLVLNSGSSSVKFQLIQPKSGASLLHGIVERIGDDNSSVTVVYGDRELRHEAAVADYESALRVAFDLFSEAGGDLVTLRLVAVGHRVVHGGKNLYLSLIHI